MSIILSDYLMARETTAFLVTALLAALALTACQGMFEDRDPEDPCDGVDCSGHGRCFVDGDDAFCRCDDGFEDDGLECVAEGAGGDADVDSDSDDDGAVCEPNCGGRECGSDGCGGSCAPGCSPNRWCDDGACSVFCAENLGWGNACSGVEICDDGSSCESIIGLESYGSLCVAECSSDEGCPDIASGSEQCLAFFCLVQCDTAADCPCGMECRGSPFGPYCYP